ncbi:DNA-methyltransferase [Amycolatopsis sp. NPDC004378]
MSAPLLLRGDARALPLADESVDLVVTSPPYFGLRSYQDGGEHYAGQLGAEASPREFVDALIGCTREMVRVLKPTGSIFVNLGDKYAAAGGHTSLGATPSPFLNPMGRKGEDQRAGHGRHYRGSTKVPAGFRAKSLLGIPWRYALRCIDDLELILRGELIWSKSNGMPESATDRVRRSHETWFHLTKEQRYFAAVDEIREPPSGYVRPNGTGREPRGGQKARTMLDTVNPRGRVPGSVWEISTQPLHAPAELGVDHYAAFPMEWPRRLITGWCPPDGVVLDPFGGTGTTALVATMLGHTGISIDRSADYGRLAAWRCSDPKERARAAGTDPTKVSAEVPGQADLFAALGGAS